MAQNERAQSTVTLNGEQAKQEMTVLAKKAAELRQKLDEANKAGDDKAFAKYRKELNATTKQMGQMAREAFDVKKVLDDLSGSSIKDLETAQRKLWQSMRNGEVKRGTKEWDEYEANLKRVRTEISKINKETSAGAVGTEKFSGGFRQMVAGAIAGIAAITGIYQALDKFRQLRMKLEDSQANLKSITGLDDSDIEWLTEQAKKLSTSTTEAGVRITASSQEIIDGYTVIGSKRPDLLKNKEAMAEVTKQALMLAAAGKMDVVEAFEAVTASMNQFNLGADQSNRIINVLGAGALEGSAEINDLSGSMKNVGTVAANSNMSLEQTIAALEVLASKQLLGEEAGTKLRGALLKMKEANVGYASGAFNMRDALVEVNSKLESKTSAMEKDAYLQKVFGIENITAGMILLDNVNSYDKLTKAITNTTVAEGQAAINTSTDSAKWAQKKNIMNEAGMALVKNMNPALLALADVGIKVMQVFTKYPALAYALVAAIGSLTIAYISNSVAAMANALWIKIVGQATEFANSKTVIFFKTLMKNPYVAISVAVLSLILYMRTLAIAARDAEKQQGKFNQTVKDSEKEINSESIQIDTLFARLNAAKKGTNEWETAKKAIISQYGDYLTGLGTEIETLEDTAGAYDAITEAVVKSARARGLAAATKTAADDLVENQAKVKEKVKKLLDKTWGKDSKESIKYEYELFPMIDKGKGPEALSAAFKKIFDVWQDGLQGNEIVTNDMITLFKLSEDYFKTFDIINKQAESKFKDYTKPTAAPTVETKEGDEKLIDGVVMIYTNKKWVKKKIKTPPDPDQAKKDFQKKVDKVDTETITAVNDVKQKYLDKDESVNTELKYQAKLQEVIIAGLEKKKALYAIGSKEWAELNEQILDTQLKGQEDKVRIQKELDAKALESFKKSNESELSTASANDMIARKGLENDLRDKKITQEQYDQAIIDQDAKAALKRLDIAEKYAEDVADFKFGSEEDKITTVKAANDAVLAADKDYQDAKKKQTKDGLDDIRELEQRNNVSDFARKRSTYKKDIELLKTALKEKKITLERFEQDKRALTLKYVEDKAQDVLNIANEAANLSGKLQETEALAVENKYAKQLKAAEGNAEATTALQEKMEGEKKKIKKKYADIDLAISVGQIIANTAVAIMKAAPNIPLQVLTGLTGVAELALAIQQRAAIKNLWTGGFTEPGDKYKPAGIVHAGEFVGNQDSVANNTVKKVYRLIDYAQKTNTVARITNEDIATAVGIRRGYSAGGMVTSERRSPIDRSNNLSSVVPDRYLYNILKSLDNQLSKPIRADVSLLGRNGLHETQNFYTKMENNTSRI